MSRIDEKERQEFLVAMPGFDGGFFGQSIILLTESNEEGTVGFALNKPTDKSIGKILEEAVNRSIAKDLPILFGGPVKTEFFWALHKPIEGLTTSIPIGSELMISSGHEVVPNLAEMEIQELLACGLGYSGWGKGQLDDEIKDGAWWKLECDANNILDILDIPVASRWEFCLSKLGINLSDFLCDRDNNFIN